MRVRFRQMWWDGTRRYRSSANPVEVPDDMRDQLPKSAVIMEESDDGASKSEIATPKPASKSELNEAILAAADELDPLDEDAFTSSGKPQVNALSAELGYHVTADERDEAWEEKED